MTDAQARPAAGALWDFAVEAYARPGVAAACLALQDEHGLDVPLALWALWAGSVVGELSEASVRAAVDRVEPWRRNVVEPLRDARRWMKTNAGVSGTGGRADRGDRAARLRTDIAAAELAAERCQLDDLGYLTDAIRPRTDGPAGSTERLAATAMNLDRVAAAQGVNVAEVRVQLAWLSAAVTTSR